MGQRLLKSTGLRWTVPVLFDLMQLHLSVNNVSVRFSELVTRAQAVSRPSPFPQCSKRDEAAVCHVYGGLSAWQGVRHSFGSTPHIQTAASSTCSPILLLTVSSTVPPASSSILASTVLPPEIWFLIKSTVNGCSSCNKNEGSQALGWGVSWGNRNAVLLPTSLTRVRVEHCGNR